MATKLSSSIIRLLNIETVEIYRSEFRWNIMATTQTPRRRIRVRKAIPADAEIIGKIHDDAFASSVMSRLMFPKGPSADASAKFIASLFPAENPDRPPDPREVILMVAELLPEGADDDLASGEVVAFAKWVAVREELPESVWNVVEPVTAEAIGEGVDLEVFNAFIGGLHKIRRERLKGNPILREFYVPMVVYVGLCDAP